MKKPVLKISDKLTKLGELSSIHFYDNGYMIEFSGRNSSDDWASVKLMCKTLDDVRAYLDEADQMPRDSS